MPKPMQLPSRLPSGSKYVIESHGQTKSSMLLIHRYVELPDGQRVDLAPRLVPIRKTASSKSEFGSAHIDSVRLGKVHSREMSDGS